MLQVFYELTPNVYTEMQTVRYKAWQVGTACRSGEAYTGAIPFDDPDGSLTIKGWRKVRVYETTATPTLLWSGRIHNKTVKRGDSDRPSLRTGAARWWDCDAVDQNTLLGSRIIQDDGDPVRRPAETAGERLRWLLSTSFTILVDDGHVTYPSNRLDPADYTLQTAADVLADCAQPGGYNFFALQTDDTGFPELFFMLPGDSDWASSVAISDDPNDVDYSTVFPPNYDATVDIIDEQVASGVAVPYNGPDGDTPYVYVSDSDIGDEFAYVDKAAPMANVKTSTKATTIANRHLQASSTEAERITCTVHLPGSMANAIRPWHLIDYKSTWMPRFGEYRACRVTDWSIEQQPWPGGGDGYLVHLQLSPVEAAQDCIVAAYNADDGNALTATVTNTPSGFYTHNSNYDTVGDYVTPTPSGLVFYQSAGAAGLNARPAVGYTSASGGPGGGWSFRNYGASFPAAPDGTGDGGLAPFVKIWIIGAGTMTLWITSGGTSTVKLFKVDLDSTLPIDPANDVYTELSSESGTYPSMTIEVPDDGACAHVVQVADDGSNLLLYGGFDWEAA